MEWNCIELAVEFVENARSELGQIQHDPAPSFRTRWQADGRPFGSHKSMQTYAKVLRPRNEEADHWSGHAGSHEGCFGKSGGAEVSYIAHACPYEFCVGDYVFQARALLEHTRAHGNV